MVENDTNQDDFEVIENSEDADFVPESDTDTDKTLAQKLKHAREKLRICEDEKRAHLEELQRVRADFLNSKRRLEEQFIRDKERAADKLLVELLTLVDSFDTAMLDRTRWESIDATWRSGIEGIHAKLLSLLKSNNVEIVDPTGEVFNPNEHEAVSNRSVTDGAEVGKIVAVLQKGFKRHETLLRPARVVVGEK
jgi:molecular chaperone GrpE